MSTKVNFDVIEPLTLSDPIPQAPSGFRSIGKTSSMEQPKGVKTPLLFKTFNFWIETTIFLLSVIGAFCISYSISQGWLLWFASNIICILYFGKQKQYPLATQQVVFLITTIIGIVNNYKDIFGLG